MPSEAFNKAAEQVKTLSATPSNDEKLKLYALFKQASVGDNDTAKPGMFDMTGKAKWQAWMDIKGKTKEAAEQEYMDVCQGFSDISFGAQPFVGELIGKYGCA